MRRKTNYSVIILHSLVRFLRQDTDAGFVEYLLQLVSSSNRVSFAFLGYFFQSYHLFHINGKIWDGITACFFNISNFREMRSPISFLLRQSCQEFFKYCRTKQGMESIQLIKQTTADGALRVKECNPSDPRRYHQYQPSRHPMPVTTTGREKMTNSTYNCGVELLSISETALEQTEPPPSLYTTVLIRIQVPKWLLFLFLKKCWEISHISC